MTHVLWPILEQEIAGSDLGRAVDTEAARDFMRDPDDLCRPAALATLKESDLSFAAAMLRAASAEGWSLVERRLELDDSGRGEALYRVRMAGYEIGFQVISDYQKDASREGRLSDNYFDGKAILFASRPSAAEMAEQKAEIEQLWRGRASSNVIGWTLANRSVENVEAVVDQLCHGRQPDISTWNPSRRYLLRNAGFYGNGRQGGLLWQELPDGHPLKRPYFPEMLALYLWREFGFDLAEHLATRRRGIGCRLEESVRRGLGIGNSSGLGMVAVLTRWPWWVDAWVAVREACRGLAATLSVSEKDGTPRRFNSELSRRAQLLRDGLEGYEPEFVEAPAALVRQVDDLLTAMAEGQLPDDGRMPVAGSRYFARVFDYANAHMSPEGRELVHAAAISSIPGLAECGFKAISRLMQPTREVDVEQSLEGLQEELARSYGWIREIPTVRDSEVRFFWYRSSDNGEHRRGERGTDPGEEREILVDIPSQVEQLMEVLSTQPSDHCVGRFLFDNPRWRGIVERLHSLRGRPYAEMRDRCTRDGFLPLWVIRFYLTTLGLQLTDPKNWRWVRGVFFRDTPSMRTT